MEGDGEIVRFVTWVPSGSHDSVRRTVSRSRNRKSMKGTKDMKNCDFEGTIDEGPSIATTISNQGALQSVLCFFALLFQVRRPERSIPPGPFRSFVPFMLFLFRRLENLLTTEFRTFDAVAAATPT
jgi:hypothetical protein